MAMKLDMKNLPVYAKAVIAVLPAVIILVAGMVLFVMPKQKEIKTLEAKIDDQNNKIATNQAKAAKLETLKQENERLLSRLNELKEQLPEEKEISGLLKQISDLSTAAGLDIKSWKPGQKKMHPSGIVLETPIAVTVSGTYHDFAAFLSSLTKLNRIVNITDIKMGSPQMSKGRAVLQINFTAATFSAAPEGGKEAQKGKGAGKR
jgi:type IV pilus assembly protein PilO